MAKGTPANRNETFGRLLSGMVSSIAYYEGKSTAIVEEELGAALNVVGKTVQRYKAGYLPPGDEAVRVLAEAAVRRGFLGREWLQRFLHAARYPFADKLLDELCPAPQVRPRPPRVYENLPAPTYSQFVMREQAFAEVLDGLSKRTAVVLIVGLGGNGKTSLAREVAARCLSDASGIPRFHAVVWVSDKDRPGTTNLSTVLDEIARTLDYPGFTQFDYEEKRREVEQLLRRQQVLVVIDNFETITDGALLTWLLNLPEPSKALVTSREYRREWRSSWPVELRGMSAVEAWAFTAERLELLRMSDILSASEAVESLIAATGGNPKAIGLTLGLVKYERRSLHLVLEDLYAARGELFDDLFLRAWALLDEAARRILIAAPLFPRGASRAALGVAADVQSFVLDRSIERLADLALLDVQHVDVFRDSLYTLHPLVRAFTRMRQQEQPMFTRGAYERWVASFLHQLVAAEQGGESAALELMSQHSQTIQAFLDQLYEQQHWQLYLQLYIAAHPLLNIAPLHRPRVDYPRWAAEAAGATGAYEVQLRSLLQLTRLYVYHRELDLAQNTLAQAEQLWDAVLLDAEARHRVSKRMTAARALTLIYTGRSEPAYNLLTDYLAQVRDPEDISEISYYRALCRRKLGRNQEAKQLLITLLEQPDQALGRMTVCRACATLAGIYLEEGEAELAVPVVKRHAAVAFEMRDRYQIARVRRSQSWLLEMQGEWEAARDAILEAIDLFERIGMRRELAEARQALADLDAGAAAGEAAAPA